MGRSHAPFVSALDVSLDVGPPLLAIGAHGRFGGPGPLEHDTRAAIYQTVSEPPHISLVAVADRSLARTLISEFFYSFAPVPRV